MTIYRIRAIKVFHNKLTPPANKPGQLTARAGAFSKCILRREAPHNQRIQHTSPVTNRFVPGLAADPQLIRFRVES